MNTSFRVDLGTPALLEFRGPDAVRFLNGQVTQDVKSALNCDCAKSACVTDAKGKIQFRVYLTETRDGALWVSAVGQSAEDLEARLTKYLIADDVEVTDLTGKFHLYHLIGAMIPAEGNAFAKRAARFGVDGEDLWIPADESIEFPYGLELISDDELEAFRISYKAPAWGMEVTPGMLPPEADLDKTDISYHKGCYIGQEVISRIKMAGKVNRSLVALMIDANAPAKAGDDLIAHDEVVGVLTSVSPIPKDGFREALGFVKRNGDRGGLQIRCESGEAHEVKMRC